MKMNDPIECPNCNRLYYPEHGKCPYCSGTGNTIEYRDYAPGNPALLVGRLESITSGAGLKVKAPPEMNNENLYFVGTTSTFSKPEEIYTKHYPKDKPESYNVVFKNENKPVYNTYNLTKQESRQNQELQAKFDIDISVKFNNDIKNVQKDIKEHPEKYTDIPDEILKELNGILENFKYLDRNKRNEFLRSKRKYFDWFDKNKDTIIKSLPLIASVTERLLGILV